MIVIDPHVHLFNLEEGDYHWLKPENSPFWPDKQQINQNFSEHDLQVSVSHQLAGFVHIEAGFNNQQPALELQWLQQQVALPFKAIAYIDLTLPKLEFSSQLNTLLQGSTKSILAGCRYILDDNAEQILHSTTAQHNLALLAEHNLLFECQMPLTHEKSVALLANTLEEHSTLTVILNHQGFSPELIEQQANNNTDELKQQWLSSLNTLSSFEHCAIKCSGWEMSHRQYNEQQLQKIVQTCLYFFGENRVMLASNFPLCLLSKTYAQLWQQYTQLPFDNRVIEKLCYHNAKHWYALNT